MAKTFQYLTLEQQQQVAIIRLSRPEKRNALNFALLQELIDVAHQLAKDRQLRAIILTGDAQVFSAGIDLNDLNQSKNKLFAFWELLKPTQSLFQQACLIWQNMPVPVIAVIEGYCFGAGLQLALACDMRVSAKNAQYSIMESRWGLVPDMGISHSLKSLIPIDIAKKLTWQAERINAETALEYGLITEIADNPLEHALQFSEQICQRSPDAILAGKRVLNAMLNHQHGSLYLEKFWQLKLLVGQNTAIARKKAKNQAIQFLKRQYR